jgi:uncharacterized protein YbjQ (UPF0145 family)
MEQYAVRVRCQQYLLITRLDNPVASRFDCACGCSYYFRRCSSCSRVGYVPSVQRRSEPWHCTWCKAPNSGFNRRGSQAVATAADLATDMAGHGLQFKATARQPQPPADTQPVLIATTNDIPGYRIAQVHGDVFGLTVRARNYFSNLGAQFRTLAGGEVAGYTKLLVDSRKEARHRMWQEARALGANAVVAMRFDCNEIGDIMSEVVACGTAVTAEALEAAAADPGVNENHSNVISPF